MRFATAALLAALSPVFAHAATVTLDFDSAGGVATEAGALDGSIFGEFGVTITGTPARNNGRARLGLFDSNCGPDFGVRCTGQDGDLASGAAFGTDPQGRVLIFDEGRDGDPDDDVRGGLFRFDFDAPVTLLSVELLDIEENHLDRRLSFFGDFADGSRAALDLIDIALLSTATGDNSLRSFVFSGADDLVGFDLRFDGISGAVASVQFEDSPAVVPLPAAGFLLLGGLAALGAVRASRGRRGG